LSGVSAEQPNQPDKPSDTHSILITQKLNPFPMSIIFDNTEIAAITLHKVGNKNLDQGYTTGLSRFDPDGNLEGRLRAFMARPFTGDALFQFHHEANLDLNPMYHLAARIFANPETAFFNTGPFIIEQLYGCSDHPQVKPGVVLLAYLKDIIVDDEMVSAIGIFKAEDTEMVMNVAGGDPDEHGDDTDLSLTTNEGFPLSKMDKGVLIFNTEAGDGYRLAIVCEAKGAQMHYWKEQFLGVKAAKNNSYLTQEMLRMAKEFSQDVFAPEQKIEKAAFLNNAIDYFEAHESFDPAQFAEMTLDKDEEKREKLTNYQALFLAEIGATDAAKEGFEIAPKAVKAGKKKLQTTVKTDTGMSITISGGDGEHIERAFDEAKGMFYYKVWFMEES
jgi:hypothetical protein